MPSGVESTRVHISALDRGLSAGHQTGESAGVSPGGTTFSQKRTMGANLRLESGAEPGDFPPQLIREKQE